MKIKCMKLVLPLYHMYHFVYIASVYKLWMIGALPDSFLLRSKQAKAIPEIMGVGTKLISCLWNSLLHKIVSITG